MLGKETIAACLVNNIAHILYARCHRTQCIKRSFQPVGYNLSQRGLPHSRRSPKDKRGDSACINHLAQYRSLTYQMLLSNIIVQRLRTHTFSQGLCHIARLYFESSTVFSINKFQIYGFFCPDSTYGTSFFQTGEIPPEGVIYPDFIYIFTVLRLY